MSINTFECLCLVSVGVSTPSADAVFTEATWRLTLDLSLADIAVWQEANVKQTAFQLFSATLAAIGSLLGVGKVLFGVLEKRAGETVKNI